MPLKAAELENLEISFYLCKRSNKCMKNMCKRYLCRTLQLMCNNFHEMPNGDKCLCNEDDRLIYLVMCLTVVVIMPAMSPTD